MSEHRFSDILADWQSCIRLGAFTSKNIPDLEFKEDWLIQVSLTWNPPVLIRRVFHNNNTNLFPPSFHILDSDVIPEQLQPTDSFWHEIQVLKLQKALKVNKDRYCWFKVEDRFLSFTRSLIVGVQPWSSRASYCNEISVQPYQQWSWMLISDTLNDNQIWRQKREHGVIVTHLWHSNHRSRQLHWHSLICDCAASFLIT